MSKEIILDKNYLEEINLANMLMQYDKETKETLENYVNISKKLLEENKLLKEQLEYIRSGEYYNQLRFERDMLQDLVDKGEVSKEDKEFIDCTHRNTELLEINEEHRKLNGKLRTCIDKLEQELIKDKMEQFDDYIIYLLEKYLKILKGDSNE